MKRRSILLGLGGIGLGTGAWAVTSRFSSIVIHHSGGATGDPELLIRVHRDRQPNDPIDMIPYHFVIGNGRGMKAGEVHATRRWRWRLWGAHLSARNTMRNVNSIGICLIGNFETARVGDQQFEALVNLCQDLMQRYGIPITEVGFHGDTPGEHTACPGKNFPKQALLRALKS